MSIVPMTYISCHNETVSDYELNKDKSTNTRYDICFSISPSRLLSKCFCPNSPHRVTFLRHLEVF